MLDGPAPSFPVPFTKNEKGEHFIHKVMTSSGGFTLPLGFDELGVYFRTCLLCVYDPNCTIGIKSDQKVVPHTDQFVVGIWFQAGVMYPADIPFSVPHDQDQERPKCWKIQLGEPVAREAKDTLLAQVCDFRFANAIVHEQLNHVVATYCGDAVFSRNEVWKRMWGHVEKAIACCMIY